MRVALLYNPPDDAPDDAFDDSSETIDAISGALRRLRLEVDPVVADRCLPRKLEEGPYDFAFNIARGRGRRCREAVAAAVCDLFELPYTGSDPLTLATTLDKDVARRLVSLEIPVAPAVLLESPAGERKLEGLNYPVLVKPNDEGSSKGIRDDSIADNPTQALQRAEKLHALYGCPVLVEQVLDGPEVTVGIIGNGPRAEILGCMEIALLTGDTRFVYSVDVRRDWRRRVRYNVPPRLPGSLLLDIEQKARTAFRLLGCRDIAQMDFRLDSAGRIFFLECNALPRLNPENGDIVILTRDSIGYEGLVQRIFKEALHRTGFTL